MIPALGAGGRGFDSPLAPFTNKAFLAQMVERWPFKPMVVGSIPTEGAIIGDLRIVTSYPRWCSW